MKKFVPVPIILLLFLFSTISFAHYEHFKIPTATITIDGNGDDWSTIEPALEDDVNDEDPDANYKGTDFHKLYLAKDDTFLYIMMTLYDGAPYTDLPDDWSSFYFVEFSQSMSFEKIGDIWSSATYVKNDEKWYIGVSEITSLDPFGLGDIIQYDSSKFVGIGTNFIEWKVHLSAIGSLNGKYIAISIHPQIGGQGGNYPASDWANSYVHIVDEDTTTTTPTPTATSTPTPKATPTPTPATETGVIYGTVTDESGSLFRGVTVSLTGANRYSKSTKTDGDGYYEFKNLAAGDYTITYEKDDYQTKTQEVSLEEDETVDLGIIVMEQVEKGSISGYVVDITGDPVESAKLKLKGISTGISKIEITDADGFFEFADLEADNYLITAKRKRYRSARKTVTIEEGEATEVEIEMRKTTKRRGISLLMRGK